MSDSGDADSQPAGQCGDAVVDDGEACDDGNTANGDGCNVDCRPSGDLQWCTTIFSLPAHAFGPMTRLATPDAGVVAAGDRQKDDGAGSLGWVASVDSSGQISWEIEVSPPEATSFSVSDIALVGQNIVVVGRASYGDLSPNGWVAELDGADGALVREKKYVGVLPYSVAVRTDGLLLAGAKGLEAWVATTDMNWDLTWEEQFSYGPLLARALAIGDRGGGKIGVTGTAILDPENGQAPPQAFYREYESDVVTLDRMFVHPEMATVYRIPSAFAPRANGVLVAGTQAPLGPVVSAAYLWAVDPETEIVEEWDISAREYGVLYDLDYRLQEGVFVVGGAYDTLPTRQWISRRDPLSLEAAWSHEGMEGLFRSVSVAALEPAVYAAGTETRSLDPVGNDVVVCKFSE